MPGVAQLSPYNNVTLMVVFEGFWGSGRWGDFSVQERTSFDGGTSWSKGRVIYYHEGRKAGAVRQIL